MLRGPTVTRKVTKESTINNIISLCCDNYNFILSLPPQRTWKFASKATTVTKA